jgi:hypothetical protein
MLAKTFKGGRTLNGAVSTINYLLDSRVSEGTAKVIFGDSEITLALIEEASKKQKWSWFSGVLTFSEILDERTKHEIIRDFMRVFFAGLNGNQFNILWVNHQDKGRTELHYIGPRLELTTGKSMNPYFVNRDFNKKDLWQEKINIEYGFTSHLDKLNATSQKMAIWSKDSKSLVTQIDEKIITLIKSDEINCRDDIISKLREDFELGSIENGFLEIIDNDGRSHKLKGEIYNKNYVDWASLLKGRIERSKVTANNTPRNLEMINKSLNEIVEKQAYSNQKNYGKGSIERKYQISIDSIKLEPLTKNNNNSKKYQTKKGSENDSVRASIDKLLGSSQESARRRKIRITKIAGNSRKLLDFIEYATDKDYRVIGESLRAWWKERQHQDYLEALLQNIGQAAQDIRSWAAGRHREIQRRLARRHTTIERSFSKRNEGIVELMLLKFGPEEKMVTMQKIKNAKSRRQKNKPSGETNKTAFPKNG